MNKRLREKFRYIVNKKIINEYKHDGDPDTPVVIPPEQIRPLPRQFGSGVHYYETNYPDAYPIFHPETGELQRWGHNPNNPKPWRGMRAKWSPRVKPPRPPQPPNSY